MDDRERLLRERVLQLAQNTHETPEQVIKRAQAYLDFVQPNPQEGQNNG